MLLSWMWLPLTHCTSPLDCISHHSLHSHIPIHHYTNHTAVTIHSLVLIFSPHLHLIYSLTFKQHSHMHSPRSLVLPRLTFWAFHPAISAFDPGLPDLGILCLWPRPLPGIVYVSALPLIFLFCLPTIACSILPLSNKYILLQVDPLASAPSLQLHKAVEICTEFTTWKVYWRGVISSSSNTSRKN